MKKPIENRESPLTLGTAVRGLEATDDEPPLIALRRVWKSFADGPVLRDVSLSVRRGETLVIIGQSGCGKSVTMKLMMALLPPSRGDVLWNDRPLAARPEREIARERLRFGYLFQGAALFDSLDVFENVAFGLRQQGTVSEAAIRNTVHERLREVGLDETICTRKPAELSGGMKKRVGLARALALEPDVMFYDEPTTGLDPIMSSVIDDLIAQTKSRHAVTSIVVTHEMRTVRHVADRVVMLDALGRREPHDEPRPQILFTGTPQELFASTDPRVAEFVGDVGRYARRGA